MRNTDPPGRSVARAWHAWRESVVVFGDPHAAETYQAHTVSGVSCIACGYDLVGLPGEGVCPECGVEVRRSLRFQRPTAAQASRLRRGAAVVAMSLTMAAGAAMLLVLHRPTAAGVALLAALPAWLVGWWLLTSTIGGGDDFRWAVRTVYIILAAGAVACGLATFVPVLWMAAPIVAVALAVGWIDSFLWAGMIADRLRSPVLGGIARHTAITIPLLCVVLAAGGGWFEFWWPMLVMPPVAWMAATVVVSWLYVGLGVWR